MEKYLIEILEVRGNCVANHYVGEKIIMEGFKTPSGICIHVFNALYPWLQVLRFNGKIPWEKEREFKVACPDHKNQVVVGVFRIDE